MVDAFVLLPAEGAPGALQSILDTAGAAVQPKLVDAEAFGQAAGSVGYRVRQEGEKCSPRPGRTGTRARDRDM
jgi:hypothetical protein